MEAETFLKDRPQEKKRNISLLEDSEDEAITFVQKRAKVEPKQDEQVQFIQEKSPWKDVIKDAQSFKPNANSKPSNFKAFNKNGKNDIAGSRSITNGVIKTLPQGNFYPNGGAPQHNNNIKQYYSNNNDNKQDKDSGGKSLENDFFANDPAHAFIIAQKEKVKNGELKPFVQERPQQAQFQSRLQKKDRTQQQQYQKQYGLRSQVKELSIQGEAEEPVDESAVMRKCNEISKKLEGTLAQNFQHGFLSNGDVLITKQNVIDSCGKNSQHLKSYQLVGINFLTVLSREKLGGAILADDMGLGKSAQAISFLGVLKHMYSKQGPHIVIANSSLLDNWAREFRMWAPNLKVIPYYGNSRKLYRQAIEQVRRENKDCFVKPKIIEKEIENTNNKQDNNIDQKQQNGYGSESEDEKIQYDRDSEAELDSDADSELNLQHEDDQNLYQQIIEELTPKDDKILPFNVILTGYSLFERSSQNSLIDRQFLSTFDFSHMILDEGHAVKNIMARRSRNLFRIGKKCQMRVILSGTPLQNDLQELVALLQFINPKVFIESDSLIEKVRNLSINKDKEEEKMLITQIQKILGPFILRRLKSEVATQLTAKVQKVEYIDPLVEQKELYYSFLKRVKSQITQDTADNKVATDENKLVKKMGQKRIKNMFVELRKIAQHPLLVRSNYNDEQLEEIAQAAYKEQYFGETATLDRVRSEVMQYSDYTIHQMCQLGITERLRSFQLDSNVIMQSTKIQYLKGLLKTLRSEGARILIFSQWTQVLDLLEWFLHIEQYKYQRLDGSTQVEDRLEMVDKYNEDKEIFIFLLSTRAGGQGINLTGANTVILHDVDFNPQIDRQAEDRCHRLGQTKAVTVYRLITKGTVDQNIYEIAERKMLLDKAVIGNLTTNNVESDNKETQQQSKQHENKYMGQILTELLAAV